MATHRDNDLEVIQALIDFIQICRTQAHADRGVVRPFPADAWAEPFDNTMVMIDAALSVHTDDDDPIRPLLIQAAARVAAVGKGVSEGDVASDDDDATPFAAFWSGASVGAILELEAAVDELAKGLGIPLAKLPSMPFPPDPFARLAVDLDNDIATFDETTYALPSHEGAALLHHLKQKRGGWMTGPDMRKADPIVGRASRVLEHLPLPLRDIIETDGPKGFRLKL